MTDIATAAPASNSSNGEGSSESPGGSVAGLVSKPAPKPGAKAPAAAPPQSSGKPRMTNGQFAPNDANAQPPDEAPTTEAEAKAEARRFKGKAKIFGQEEDFDYGEDDLPKLHQRIRMFEKKEADIRKTQKEATSEVERLYRALRENPVELLREAGHDPQALARKQLAEQARLGAMDEHERALFERDQKIQEFEAKEKQRDDAEKQLRKQALRQHIGQKQEKFFLDTLQKANVPQSPEGLRLVLETYNAMQEDFGRDAVANFSPEELAQETERRLGDYTDRFLGTLDGAGLRRKLGPKRVAAIIEAELSEFRASQPFEQASPENEEPPAPTRSEEGFIDEAEAKRRLRSIR